MNTEMGEHHHNHTEYKDYFMSQIPTALLLISTSCQHCPTMLKNLSELIEEGKISSLEIVNIAVSPERAEALNVRTVPWLKLEEYELTGLKSKSELLEWIDKAGSSEGQRLYFEELIGAGRITEAQKIIEEKPWKMPALLAIMDSESTTLSLRIGVSAIIEQLAGSKQLIENIDTLSEYCQHELARVRNDACYYLGLSRHADAEEHIRPLLNDESDEVKETAKEALEEIKAYTNEALQSEGIYNITI